MINRELSLFHPSSARSLIFSLMLFDIYFHLFLSYRANFYFVY